MKFDLDEHDRWYDKWYDETYNEVSKRVQDPDDIDAEIDRLYNNECAKHAWGINYGSEITK
jgi:hypothetical protein